MPTGNNDPATIKFEAHRPDELEPGGKAIQIIATVYPNETDVAEIIERLTKPSPQLPDQKRYLWSKS